MRQLRELCLLIGLFLLGGTTAVAEPPKHEVIFNIPAQPLREALNAFGKQTGLSVAFYDAAVADSTTEAISGRFTAEAALEKLLVRSGLEYRFVNERTVAIYSRERATTNETLPSLQLALDDSTVAEVQQTPSRGGARGGSDSEIEEIIVTAQKRSERLQDVPTSMAVLSVADLEARGYNQMSDYAKTVPGLRMVGAGGPGEGQAVLRGVSAGNDRQAVVGLYLDDAPFTPSSYHGWTGLTFDPALADIERIEVLKGPQSTLYGASALGGLIKYVTKKPNLEKLESSVRIEGSQVDGGGSGYGARGSLNLPLVTERVAVRASAFYREDPGYIDDTYRGRENANTSTVKGGRFSLLATLGDNVTTTFSGLLQDVERDAYTSLLLDPITLEPAAGQLSNSSLIKPSSLIEYRYLGNTTEIALPFGTLTNILSYTESGYDVISDATGLARLFSPGSGGSVHVDFGAKRYSDELRLAGAVGRVAWLLGAFYTEEKDATSFDARTTDANGVIVPTTSPFYNIYTFRMRATFDEKAIFGNLTYDLTERLEATVGARYSENDQNFDIGSFGLLLPTGGRWGFPTKESSTNYLVSLSYKPKDNVTLYARAASAYRPGGPNVLTQAQIAAGAPATFVPDTLWNYEAGIKGSLWNNKLSYAAAAYHMDWRDIQTSASVAGFSVIGNVAKATIDGIELSLAFEPLTKLQITLNGVYNDATFGGDAPAIGALSGAPLPNAPELSASVDAEYRTPITQDVEGNAGLTFAHYSSQTSPFLANSRREISGYRGLDIRAGIDWAAYSLMLRAENITNEHGLTGLAMDAANFVGTVIRPRTFGVSFEARF